MNITSRIAGVFKPGHSYPEVDGNPSKAIAEIKGFEAEGQRVMREPGQSIAAFVSFASAKLGGKLTAVYEGE